MSSIDLEASGVVRKRASFAPSASGPPLDKPSPKWLQRGGNKGTRKLSQRTVVSTMTPRQRRLWKLQQMAIKKQMAFQQAVQSIPVSEMEKMIAAAEVDLGRASENYEKFLVASEGKGRYLWSKLRELVASWDAETKLRIKLLPMAPMERDLPAGTAAGGAAAPSRSGAQSPSSNSSSATPRQPSKAGTPRSVASASRTPRQAAAMPSGSRLGTPRSLLRAAASNAAGGPSRIEITKRPPQTVFKWRTSVNVKLATDLPAELLRHRHNHEFDKYNLIAAAGSRSGVTTRWQAAAAVAVLQQHMGELSQHHSSGSGSQEHRQEANLSPSQTHSPSAAASGDTTPGPAPHRQQQQKAAAKKAADGRQPAEGPAAAKPGPVGAASKHYGQQWFAPPKLWAACSAARQQGQEAALAQVDSGKLPAGKDAAAMSAAAGSEASVPLAGSTGRLTCSSESAKQQELQERINSNEGAQTYARHLQRAGKRLPEYLQRAIELETPAQGAGLN